MDFFICRQFEAAVALLLDLFDRLFEADRRFELRHLFLQVVDQVLCLYLRKSGNIIYVLFRIKGGELSAELGQAFDDFDGCFPHSAVEGREQPCRTSADDRDIVNFLIFLHLRSLRNFIYYNVFYHTPFHSSYDLKWGKR